jgi:hypothetical protein
MPDRRDGVAFVGKPSESNIVNETEKGKGLLKWRISV